MPTLHTSLCDILHIEAPRFLLSAEAATHPVHQERLIQAQETETVYISLYDANWPGAPHRGLRNSTFTQWEAAGCPPSGQRPGEGDVLGYTGDGRPIERYRSLTPLVSTTEDIEAMSLWGGQSVGLVTQSQPVGDIVCTVVEEASSVLQQCANLVQRTEKAL